MKINLDTNNILSFVSVSPSRIRFPYNWQSAQATDKEDILWTAHNIATRNGAELEDIADIEVFALLTANRFRIGGGFRVVVVTLSGETYFEHVAANIDPEQVNNALRKFFATGAAGLDEDHKLFFDRQHYEYMQKQSSRKSSMMLKLLESGYSVDQVLAVAAN